MTVMGGKRSLLKDGAWVTIGQIGSILGIVAGIRVLTQFVAPDIFGAVTLIVGVIALALGTLITPVMQAALKFYPEYSDGRVSLLRNTTLAILTKRLYIFLGAVALISPLIIVFTTIRMPIVLLGSILLLLDSMRTIESTLLNAGRRQATFALISIGEAWGRPFVAVYFVYLKGAMVEAVLAAYVLTSLLVMLLFYAFAKPGEILPGSSGMLVDTKLKGDILRYSHPLTPMAALGWMNGVGDRYLIGAMLGLEQAGIYAAVYGLMSRPFLMVSSIVELTLRPFYNQFVAKHLHREADRLLAKWLVTVTFFSGVGFAIIAVFDQPIINLLLAEKYRTGIALMLWIAGGYALLALSDVFIKVCYAYGYTKRIVMIQVVGAVLSLSLAVIGIKLYGLIGAAMAVPVYFGAMLIITIIASKINTQSGLSTVQHIEMLQKKHEEIKG